MLKKHIFTKLFFLFIILFFLFAIILRISFKNKYNDALTMIDNGNYQNAIDILEDLNNYNYKNVYSYLEFAKKSLSYEQAEKLFSQSHYSEAMTFFSELGNFKDSKEKVIESKYQYAIDLFQKKEFNKALTLFLELNDYRDSETYAAKASVPSLDKEKEKLYKEAYNNYIEGNYYDALNIFEELGNYKDSKEKADECKTCMIKKLSTTISSGIHYSVALKENGDLICTSSNYTFDNWHDILSISGFGTMIIGLKEDGSAVLEGHRDIYDTNKIDIIEADISKWENIIQIDAGQQHVVGLKKDGTVVSDGLLTDPNWKNIKLIAAGWKNTVGLDINGKLYIDGSVSKELSDSINASEGQWDNIIAIDIGGCNANNVTGNGHIVGLYEDGTVTAIGDNTYGQCNVNGEEWHNIIAIAAGDFHTVGLKSDGTVVATTPLNTEELASTAACNVYGEEWTNIVAISAGYGTTLGLNKYGEVVAAGFDRQNQIPKNNDENWKNIKIYKEWNDIIKK